MAAACAALAGIAAYFSYLFRADQKAYENYRKSSEERIAYLSSDPDNLAGKLDTLRDEYQKLNEEKASLEKEFEIYKTSAEEGIDVREALEKQIDASLKDNIHITGLLENPYPYIAQCDIYVQPSYEEAHPLAILEAQILCRPVVSTATAGGKTTISDGETGVLAAITAESLAEKIDEMINDRALRERIGENLGKFDWAMDKKRFRAAWKTLLEEGQKV